MSMFPLNPTVSLNRVCVADLPGVFLPPEVKGKTAYDLVSSTAMNALIRQHANKLELDSALKDHELNLAFAECIDSPAVLVRNLAERISQRIGRNLGFVLAVLKRGDKVNRQARPEWDDTYWAYWATIKTVWLGGGMVNGRLGQRIQTHAISTLQQCGVDNLELYISPYTAYLSLIGLARQPSFECQSALVMDFGSTMVKRAIAHYSIGELIDVDVLPTITSGCYWLERPSKVHLEAVLDDIVLKIAEAWQSSRDAYPSISRNIFLSMAAYIQNGHPMEARGGCYMHLREVTANLQATLSNRLSSHLGTRVDVALFHDGTAAAMTYAGEQHTAVITMGTALGIGFPPVKQSLRPIHRDLKIKNMLD